MLKNWQYWNVFYWRIKCKDQLSPKIIQERLCLIFCMKITYFWYLWPWNVEKHSSKYQTAWCLQPFHKNWNIIYMCLHKWHVMVYFYSYLLHEINNDNDVVVLNAPPPSPATHEYTCTPVILSIDNTIMCNNSISHYHCQRPTYFVNKNHIFEICRLYKCWKNCFLWFW